MSLVPDHRPDPREAEILSESPLLKTYLAGPASIGLEGMWVSQLVQHSRNIIEKINATIGEDVFAATCITALAILSSQGILATGLQKKDLTSSIEWLVAMGYEIGDPNDVRLFRSRVASRMVDAGEITSERINNRPLAAMIIQGVGGVLIAGAALRDFGEDSRQSNPKEGESRNIFRDFINGSDFQENP